MKNCDQVRKELLFYADPATPGTGRPAPASLTGQGGGERGAPGGEIAPHLEKCPECREQLAQIKRSLTLFRRLAKKYDWDEMVGAAAAPPKELVKKVLAAARAEYAAPKKESLIVTILNKLSMLQDELGRLLPDLTPALAVAVRGGKQPKLNVVRGEIRGIVEKKGGRRAAGVKVELLAAGKVVRKTRADKNGHYCFARLKKGEYQIRVTDKTIPVVLIE